MENRFLCVITILMRNYKFSNNYINYLWELEKFYDTSNIKRSFGNIREKGNNINQVVEQILKLQL